MRRGNKLTLFVCFLICTISLSAEIPANYYDSASGLSGDALKSALHDIIDNHIEYPYTSDSQTDVWDILKESDRDTTNSANVILLYSGWSVNAAQEYNGGNGWSREHVWAKSHGDFGTDPPAGTDAHHLRPADVSVNSARSNKDFDVGGEEYIDGDGATGCYADSNSWEPRDAVKGDVARMIFYMSVRYEGDESGEPDLELVDYIPSSPNGEPRHGLYSTLYQWHLEDSVDTWEINRNDTIYAYQNNRNPFIDHPEYVYEIWGSSDTDPPTVNDIFATTSTTIEINFSENVSESTAETTSNYSINNGIGNPSSAVRDNETKSLVTLTVSTLTPEVLYTLTLNNIEDIHENSIASNTQENFTFLHSPTTSDLIITEICGDDVDGDAGNDNGFMEIYNNTSNKLTLENIQLRYYNRNPDDPTYTLDLSGSINSDSYLIIAQNESSFNTTYSPVTADFYHGNFYYNGSDDGIDIYATDSKGIIDEFNDNGVGHSPWTWNDGYVLERNGVNDGSISTSWSENTTGSGSPKEENSVPLAISLSSFYLDLTSVNLNLICWITASEVSNNGWNIYRSPSSNYGQANRVNSTMIAGAGTTTEMTEYFYEDHYEFESGKSYWYWIESIDNSGETELHGPASVLVENIGDNPEAPELMEKYGLYQNYPNPFNPQTEISFRFKDKNYVKLNIYNLKGQLVKQLFNGSIKQNTVNRFIWDGTDENHKQVSSGIYYYQLQTEGYTAVKKMVLMK